MTLDPARFDGIARHLRRGSGLVIGPEKEYLLESRLGPVLRRFGLLDLAALADRLVGNPDRGLGEAVIEAMTIHESQFFRDRRPFEHFTDTVLPALAHRRPGRRIRIWSAACSFGQEPYSLAMILLDHPTAMAEHPVEILATDISVEAVDRGRSGVFSQFEVQRGLPVRMLLRHFEQQAEHWRIGAAARDLVRFQIWNLLHDPVPLGQFDVIFCRNVLIYFDDPTKAALLAHLAQALTPDGVLYLGAAETPHGLTDLLVPCSGSGGAYCRAMSGVIGMPRDEVARFSGLR